MTNLRKNGRYGIFIQMISHFIHLFNVSVALNLSQSEWKGYTSEGNGLRYVRVLL